MATPGKLVPSSQTFHVQLLYQQGVSPAEIAEILDLSAAAVDGYLGITAAEVVLLPTLATKPVPAGSPFPSISTIA